VDNLPYFNDPSFTPIWEKPEDFHTIPNFSLLNQEGEIVNQATFENKIYVADFFFTTCPGICLKMTANMSILQEAFLEDDEVLLLSHSVTPERDSVSVLESYAEDKGIINGKWHLVTGDQKEIYSLGRSSYFVEEDLGLVKTEFDFLHTENFVLIDKNKHIRGIYNGLNKVSVTQLIADIKTLQKEG
jgi:protein SCO1/2